MTDSPKPPQDAADEQAVAAAAPEEGTPAESASAASVEAPAKQVPASEASPLAPPPPAAAPISQRRTLASLPAYSRSLLKVKVPVVVTLACRTESIENITNMGPGTILQFDKSCEDPLELEAGGQPLAVGEAVKVGDKFGLRIHAMLLPHERFQSVGKKPSGKGPSKKAG